MNKNLKLLFIGLFSGSLAISCNNNKDQSALADWSSIENIEVDFNNLERVSCQSITDSAWFVKLQTNDNNLIGSIHNILFVDSSIVVYDKFIANAAFVFDLNGKFKAKLSNKGNGPKEYLDLSDLFIDNFNRIGIKDNLKSRILFYDSNGNYLETVKLPYLFDEICSLGDDKYVIGLGSITNSDKAEFNQASFAVTDKSFKPSYYIGKSLRTDNYTLSYMHNLFSYNNVIYCVEHMKDVIYKVNNDGFEAKYRFVIKPNSIYEKDFHTNDEYYEVYKNYSAFNGKFIELQDFSYFHLSHGDGKHLRTTNGFLYNHKTHSVKNLDMKTSDPLFLFWDIPIARYKNSTVVSAINAVDIISAKQELIESGGYDDNMIKLYDGLTVDSNPVLFFYDIDINK